MRISIIILLVLTSGFCSELVAQKPFYSDHSKNWKNDSIRYDIDYTLYLIGDAGAPDFTKPAALKVLENHLKGELNNSAVVFLGDNSYLRGLPDTSSPIRSIAESNIQGQLDILKNYQGSVYFIAGNHDWDRWSEKGWEGIKREEQYIEQMLKRGNVFLPDLGCPGPVEVHLSDKLVLIIIDTQWWLHQWNKPLGEKDSCDIEDDEGFMLTLTDIIQENSDKQIVLAGHHPIYSNGYHGGKFTLKDHIFPLTSFSSNLYIPLPVIGSLHPLYRKHVSNIQDIGHPRYQKLKNGLIKALQQHDDIVYAAGHEHNLQYFKVDNQNYVVSGAGSKAAYAAKKHGASFTYERQGFAKLLYLVNGEVWVEYWVTTEALNDNGEIIFRQKIKSKDAENSTQPQTTVSYVDSFITIAANADFEAGKFKTFVWGKHYRKAWITPIEVRLMDLQTERGGLTPLRLGGGMQTTSLRLADSKNNEFVFRSIQKDPTRVVLPESMQNTLAGDIMKDQISMSHPYGALVISPLSQAVGVYHKNPQLVFVPDDIHLGKYRSIYKNTLALYEERAGKHVSEFSNFGNADKAISTRDLIEALHKSHNNIVDQKDLLKNRLFDMWIGDWDRHEDQWRWAQFDAESGEGHLFKAIPRDRDQVFAKPDGLVLSIATMKFSPARKIAHFDYEINDILGLNINGREIDRVLMTMLTQKDWVEIADSMRINLTDQIIEDAIKQWPDKIYRLDGPEIIAKLKSRRAHLVEYAIEYYKILAKDVELTGSDKDEIFEIERKPNGNTVVAIFKKDKDNKKDGQLFYREFIHGETKEIRIYGFGGDDKFEITGSVKKGIKLRIIGGPGSDEVVDDSKVRGLVKLTKVYDKPKGMKIVGGRETQDLTSNNPDINAHEMKARFVPDNIAPIIKIGYNADDGVFVGGGISMVHQQWRKTPHGFEQKLAGAIATNTNAFYFNYEGKFYQFINKWDLNLNVDVLSPNSYTNFYGFGNETVKLNDDQKYYLVKFDQVNVLPTLNKKIGKHQVFKIGPTFNYFKVDRTPSRFVSDSLSALPSSAFDAAKFVGAQFNYNFSTVDNKNLPTKGIRWETQGNYLYNTGNSKGLSILKSDLSMFLTLNNRLKPTFAFRFGGATIFDDFQFYQGNTLGAQTRMMGRGNLRGYRRDRFTGRSTFYQNTEVRLKLFNFNTYLVPGQFGIYGFVDNGRVWTDEASSNLWHRGYGGGIWISPLKVTVFTASLEQSEEERFFNLHMSFLF